MRDEIELALGPDTPIQCADCGEDVRIRDAISVMVPLDPPVLRPDGEPIHEIGGYACPACAAKRA